jgi:hypothetical protein
VTRDALALTVRALEQWSLGLRHQIALRASAGGYAIEFQVSDTNGATDTATLTISVGTLPTKPGTGTGTGANDTGDNGDDENGITEREVPFLLAILLGAIVLAVAIPTRRA